MSRQPTSKPLASLKRSQPNPDLKGLGRVAALIFNNLKENDPSLLQELRVQGKLRQHLQEKESLVNDQSDQLESQFQKKGYSPQQAASAAWEIVSREQVFLPAASGPRPKDSDFPLPPDETTT